VSYSCPDWLSLLEPEVFADLTRRATVKGLDREQILFSEGDDGERAHLVLAGVVKLGTRSLDGKETIVGLAVPGDLVDPVSVLDGGRQPFDAIAATPGRVMTMDAQILRSALARNSSACLALGRALSGRTRSLIGTAVERSTAGATARVAGRLLDLTGMLGKLDRVGSDIEVAPALHQGDLARFAGVSRESASKTLARLRRAGVIDYDKRRLRVMRPEVLERIRCAGRASELFR
jgi:CRP/FNR family transcriptional regulator, cyclic AMP receptor protein